MKNLKKYLIKRIGQEKGEKVYRYFYNYGAVSVHDIVKIELYSTGEFSMIRFTFNDESTWEFSY